MKKKITPMQIAVLFTGSFLGAGFLSGQELLQFFGRFGAWGLAGMVLAIAAFWLFGWMVLDIAKRTGYTAFDKIILHGTHPVLRGFFSAVIHLFLEQLFGIPALLGDAAMTLLVLLVAVTGAAGLVAAFGVVVPLLVGAAVVVGALAVLRLPTEGLPALPFASGNPLLGNWLFSAVSFISYNMMAAITILVPLTQEMEDTRAIRRGLGLGSLLLAVIFICILLPMILFRALVGDAELPMLALASQVFPALGVLYALLLLCGMFTAALSSLFGITSRLEVRLGGRLSRRFLALLCALAFVGSIFGFKNVVSYVYPLCGYVGFFALIGVALHFRFLHKASVAENAPAP